MMEKTTDAAPATHIIIPANNEENYIAACLQSILIQEAAEKTPLIVTVAANACNDRTVEIVKSFVNQFAEQGDTLNVLDMPEPGKVGALNAVEASVGPEDQTIYLDADVICDPQLIGQLQRALTSDKPVYATGNLAVVRAQSWVTRQYARFWQRLPFVKGGAVGAGLFSVNAAGRQRWQAFPDIISDDTFVRLQFSKAERVEVKAEYHWPMIEGFFALVKVRRRQDAGVAEILKLFPDMLDNEAKASLGKVGLAKLFVQDPIGFLVYMSVHVAVRLRKKNNQWTRGR